MEEKGDEEADQRDKIQPTHDEIATRGTGGGRGGAHLASGSDGATSRFATDVSM
jgi:hypothetical protein